MKVSEDTKIERKLWRWVKENHAHIECECDHRKGKTCTATGWVRCNLRMGVIRMKRESMGYGAGK